MKKALFIFSILFSGLASNAQSWDWARGISCDINLFTNAITTDLAGNVYVAGGFSCQSVTFGNFVLNNTSSNGSDIFIVKYDPQGNVIWAKKAGGLKNETTYNIAADATGHIYVTGTFNSPLLSFGNAQLSSNDTMLYNEDLFLVKYDTAGNSIWATKAGDSVGSDRPYAIAVDAANNVYITGQHGGASINFGTGTLYHTGDGFNIFLAKFDSDGMNIWSKVAGGAGGAGGTGTTSLNVSSDGHLYMAGEFECWTLAFDNIILTKQSTIANSYDMFLVKYDTAGNAIWGRNALCGSWSNFISSTVDAYGNIYVSGAYASPSVVFGTTTLPYSGQTDMFMVKYNYQGDVMWAKGWGGGNREFGHVLCDTFGNIYTAITFESDTLSVEGNNFINQGEFDIALVYLNPLGEVINTTSVGGIETETIFTGQYLAKADPYSFYISGSYYSPSIIFGTDTIWGGSNPNNANMFLAKWVNPFATSSEVIKQNEPLTIYPNPASNELLIETQLTNYNISLINTLGQFVYQKHSCNGKQTLDVSNLADGMYYLKVAIPGNKPQTKKVMIQH